MHYHHYCGGGGLGAGMGVRVGWIIYIGKFEEQRVFVNIGHARTTTAT